MPERGEVHGVLAGAAADVEQVLTIPEGAFETAAS
jgi:hypothetical protein